MTCNGSAQGFSYLKSEIQPTRTKQAETGAIAALAVMAIWDAVIALGRQPVRRRVLPADLYGYGRPR
jgi:hypothetical protein